MEAVIFAGLQASGKSTYFARRYAETHVRLNRDMLRTRNRESVLMHACLACEQRFVVDNTNPTVAARARYLRLARAAGYTVTAVVFEVPLAQALARNAARGGKARVPDRAIAGTAAKFEPVTAAEGFDHIVRIGPDGQPMETAP